MRYRDSDETSKAPLSPVIRPWALVSPFLWYSSMRLVQEGANHFEWLTINQSHFLIMLGYAILMSAPSF